MRLRRLIARVQARVRDRRLERRGVRPVTLPNGLAVYGASRMEARYQQFVLDYFQPGVEFHPGMTVFDIGANMGMFSLEVLRRCGGDVCLFAFEPAPETFAYLERNVRELFPGAPARLYLEAVADRPGEATFYYRPGASTLSSLYSEALGGDPHAITDAAFRDPPPRYQGGRVPGWFRRLPRGVAEQLIRVGARWAVAPAVETRCTLTTVSDVLRDNAIERVDFLKVDVEGAELRVLRGIEPKDWPKVHRVAVEVHDFDHRVDTICGMLAAAGFERVQVEQDWPFEGTDIHMVHAGRAVAGGPD